jgi:hypothetical protein
MATCVPRLAKLACTLSFDEQPTAVGRTTIRHLADSPSCALAAAIPGREEELILRPNLARSAVFGGKLHGRRSVF